jgi:Domain of unknown function (DUF4405)
MQPGRREGFYWRAFVTFYVVFSFIVIAASGLVLFVAPPGRVANWSQWRFGSLLKADWQAVHTVFALLFVAAAALHVYFNWRVILNYLRRKVGEGLHRGRELGAASAVGAAVLALTLGGIPPFSTIVTLGETAKNSWSDPSTEPPVPHAELWTVAKFAETNKLTVDQAMDNLRQAGMPAPGPDTTLQALAATYTVTPRQIYLKALGPVRAASVPLAEGGGFGQKSVGEICQQVNIPVETAIDRLRQAGFTDATPDSNMRQLATANGKRPIEVAQIIQGLPPGAQEGHR